MTCPVCGARCVCRKAGPMCCSCHRHRARGPLAYLWRELAHAVAVRDATPDDLHTTCTRGDRQGVLST